MKLIIAGSRNVTSLQTVLDATKRVQGIINVTEIVSGAARGVDTLGEEVAGLLGLRIRRFPARWTLPCGATDRGAGYKRNAEMADYADCLLAVWDMNSPGTRHMISCMYTLDKRVFLQKIKL
jgi:hypothetical protein